MNYIQHKNIARVSTVPFFVYSQLSVQLNDISLAGANVTIVTSPAKAYEKEIKFDSRHTLFNVDIPRKIEILNDFKALIALYKMYRTKKFDVVHSTTPKAGLLSAIAGFFARTPIRIHTFTGQTWLEKAGLSRFLFKFLDKLIIKLNHHCYADSKSQMQFLISEGVCNEREISVLGEGSLAGVDLNRFDSNNFSNFEKKQLRTSLSVNDNSVVIIFVGRITKDKGILELLKAFELLMSNKIDASLLLVGPIDGELIIDGIDLCSYIAKHDNIQSTGFTESPEKYLSISDIFCLPSYREGFGTVIIESAAMGLPSVASNIYGLSDAVKNGETGILVDVKNVNLLAEALTRLVENKNIRTKMGSDARNRACKSFGSNKVNSLVIDEYNRLMRKLYDK